MGNVIQTIESDLQKAWGTLEIEAEVDAVILWNTFKTVFTALAPGEFVILQGLIKLALADLASGDDISAIEAAVLNLAVSDGAQFIMQLGSGVLQAVIAIIVAGVK